MLATLAVACLATPGGWKGHYAPAIHASSPAQHYYLLHGGQAASGGGGDSGSGEKVYYYAAAPQYAQAAPAVQYVSTYQTQPVVTVDSGKWWKSGSSGEKQSVSDHMDAHRRAVEEHQRAHAEALRRVEDARRSHKQSWSAG